MNNNFKMVDENIKNLTSLWRTASLPSQSYFSGPDFSYCLVEGSNWPNRLWFHQDVTKVTLLAARERMQSLQAKLIIPYWDIYESDSGKLLEESGGKVLFEQLAMGLQLNRPFAEAGALLLQRVEHELDSALWSQLFFRAFGYHISSSLLPGDSKSTHYFIAYHHNSAVGTGIIHTTGGVAGIHSIGIIPEMRRKRLAEQLMKQILNRALEMGMDYATLQASDMGKDLYLKLGFEEQFKIKNYIF